MMMSNKYKITIAIVVLLPILAYGIKNMVSDMLVSELEVMSNDSDYYAVVDLTNRNRATFDVIRDSNYDIEEMNAFENASVAALSRYFSLTEKQKKERLASQLRNVESQGGQTAPQGSTTQVDENGNTIAMAVDPATGELMPVRPDEVSFIYTSSFNKFAIINGSLYKKGDSFAKNKKIIEITQKGVKITSEGKVKWLLLD